MKAIPLRGFGKDHMLGFGKIHIEWMRLLTKLQKNNIHISIGGGKPAESPNVYCNPGSGAISFPRFSCLQKSATEKTQCPWRGRENQVRCFSLSPIPAKFGQNFWFSGPALLLSIHPKISRFFVCIVAVLLTFRPCYSSASIGEHSRFEPYFLDFTLRPSEKLVDFPLSCNETTLFFSPSLWIFKKPKKILESLTFVIVLW